MPDLLVLHAGMDDFQSVMTLCLLQLETLLRTWPHPTPQSSVGMRERVVGVLAWLSG